MKSKDGQRLFLNFSYLSLLQIANYILPLITLPYLARVIGVYYFGIIAIGTAVVSYFQTITDYGFNYTSVRDIVRCKNDINEISKIVSTTIFARIFLMIISLVLLFIGFIFIPFLYENRIIILYTFLLIPGYVLFVDWFFQAMEDMKYITLFNVLSKFLFTIFVFLVIKEDVDYIYQPVLIAAGYFISSIFCLYIMNKKYHVKIYYPGFDIIISEIVKGFNMFVSIFLPTVYSNINILLLGNIKGANSLGIYSGGTKFTSISYNVISLFSRVFYPYLSRRLDMHYIYVIISFVISVFISLILFFGANIIVDVFLGKEFYETVLVLKILAFTPIAMSVMNSYGINFLVLRGKEKVLRNIVSVTSVVGIFLGVVGAIYYGYIGVAVCTLIIEFLRAFLVFIFAGKYKL